MTDETALFTQICITDETASLTQIPITDEAASLTPCLSITAIVSFNPKVIRNFKAKLHPATV